MPDDYEGELRVLPKEDEYDEKNRSKNMTNIIMREKARF